MCLAVQRDTQEFDALQNVLLTFVIVLQKIAQTALAQQRHALFQLSGHVFQGQLLGRPLVQHGHHFGDHRVQFVNVDGFEDIVYGFHLQSITQISHICIAADKYDFDAGIALMHIFGQCDAPSIWDIRTSVTMMSTSFRRTKSSAGTPSSNTPATSTPCLPS